MKDPHKARQVAVQALYWLGTQPSDPLRVVQQLAGDEKFENDAEEFVASLVTSALDGQDTYDDEIDTALENWSPERVGRMERIVLRLALCEIDSTENVTVVTIIDEAVELAGEFSGEESAGFVNGVLDRVVRQRAEAGPAAY